MGVSNFKFKGNLYEKVFDGPSEGAQYKREIIFYSEKAPKVLNTFKFEYNKTYLLLNADKYLKLVPSKFSSNITINILCRLETDIISNYDILEIIRFLELNINC